MTALLRRGIAEQDLVRVCWEEWQKMYRGVHPMYTPEGADDKNVVSAYRKIAHKLAEKP
jgi:hypothetical protein